MKTRIHDFRRDHNLDDMKGVVRGKYYKLAIATDAVARGYLVRFVPPS